MNILITGGTGFIGRALCQSLVVEQHQLVVLSRYPETVPEPAIGIAALAQLEQNKTLPQAFDVVINLAGEPIANKRWSDAQKQRIISSRIDTTETLIHYFKQVEHKPKVFISGSAIGYYGVSDHATSSMQLSYDVFNLANENSTGDDSFSSQLCQQWEASALQAQDLGIRTCLLRTGIVLGKDGGALSKMLPPFKLGLGGRIGNGKQWMPWIHRDDLIGIIKHCIHNDTVQGAINGTAPNPVTSQVFSQTLGAVLKRPAIFPMPAIVVKLLMGQMGKELLPATPAQR